MVLSTSWPAPGPPCSPGICMRNFVLPSATRLPLCGNRITEELPQSPKIFPEGEQALPGFFAHPGKAPISLCPGFWLKSQTKQGALERWQRCGKGSALAWCLGCTWGVTVSGDTRAWSCGNVCSRLCSSAVACAAPADGNQSHMRIWTEKRQSETTPWHMEALTISRSVSFLCTTKQKNPSCLILSC